MAKTLLEVASKQLETCLEYRKTRFEQIKKTEDMYLGKTLPAAKGRFNIPVPILEGFIQTLQSKIDDTIKVRFRKEREATLKTAKKLTALWEKDSSPDNGDYNGADLDAKSLAIFAGFGTLKLIPQSKPYQQRLEAIDHHDLVFEPMGGRNLENHLFKGQLNIFKTRKELVEGEGYSRAGVQKLINQTSEQDTKFIHQEQEQKIQRYLALGLNPKNYNYVGTDVYNLTEMVTQFEGELMYILFNYEKQISLREAPLKEIYGSNLSPWVVWHTDRNPVNFLNRSPADSVYPVAEAMRILINQNFDNIQKRNWDMVLYNAKKVINPAEFEYRPNGLIRLKLNDGESIDTAYRKVETPDTSTITINLMSFLNSFLGEKTGVTPTVQGTPETDVLGIQTSIIQQTADRFGLLNKFYTQAHIQIAKRWKANLKDYLPANTSVRIVGVTGVKDEIIKRSELEEDLGVEVASANVEAQNDQVTQRKQENAIITIIKDPELKQQVGGKWLIEQVLRIGEFDEDNIKQALSGDESGNAELMSEAAEAIEAIENGEEPKINRGANVAFIRKIQDYAYSEYDDVNDPEDNAMFQKLMEYAVAHVKIAEDNAIRMNPMAQAQPNQQLPEENTQNTELPQVPLPTQEVNEMMNQNVPA